MTARQYAAAMLSAGLLLANLSVAATQTPTPAPGPAATPPATTSPVEPICTSPYIAWVSYGGLVTQWRIVPESDFDVLEDCEQFLHTYTVVLPRTGASCYRVGVDPNLLDDQPGSVPVAPVVK
jgi:hypothetical protein